MKYKTEKEVVDYLEKNLNGDLLEAFHQLLSIKNQKAKTGMIEKSKKGFVMSRAPFGYKIVDKNLIPDEEKRFVVRQIFANFRDGESLNSIANKSGLTINGIKKILKNNSYIGKTKFDGQISDGNHPPIIELKLFNDVQKIFEEKDLQKSISK